MVNKSLRPCPACKSTNSQSGFTLPERINRDNPSRYIYRRCLNCQTQFVDPVPSEEELPAYYPPGYWWTVHNSDSGHLPRLLTRYRSMVVRDHLRYLKHVQSRWDKPCLLDVGCGSGSFLEAARNHGFEVTGLDFSPEAVEQLRRRDIPAAVGNLMENDLADQRFEIITLFHILEHLRNPSQELEVLLASSVAGGDVIIQVPNCQSLQAKLLGPRWHGLDPPRHLTQFSLKGIQLLIRSLNLQIIHTFHFSLRDNPPSIVSSLFPTLDPIYRHILGMTSKTERSQWAEVLRAFLYLGLVVAALPLAVGESVARRGGSVVIHARKK